MHILFFKGPFWFLKEYRDVYERIFRVTLSYTFKFKSILKYFYLKNVFDNI